MRSALAWLNAGHCDEPGDQTAGTRLVPHGCWSLRRDLHGQWSITLIEQDATLEEFGSWGGAPDRRPTRSEWPRSPRPRP
jgi:hypothetical protein